MENEVLRIARIVRAQYPHGKNKGRCFDACADLVRRMENASFNCSIQFGWVDGNDHCWVEVWKDESPRIIDVTVDQFGFQWPAILWGRPVDYPQYVYDDGSDRSESIKIVRH